MTSDLLTILEVSEVPVTFLEGHPGILHLLIDCIPPEMVVVLFIDFEGFLDGLRQSMPMFLVLSETFRLCLADDGLSLLLDTGNPP